MAAQDPSATDQVAVGTWLVESNLGDAEYSIRLMTLGADGSAIFASGQQTTGLGSWEATSDTTAIATFAAVTNGPAWISIRVQLDFAPGGQSFAGVYTIEAILGSPDGETSGEIGPGTLSGTRLVAEAPGTPVASFEEFFPPQSGTPAATPSV